VHAQSSAFETCALRPREQSRADRRAPLHHRPGGQVLSRRNTVRSLDQSRNELRKLCTVISTFARLMTISNATTDRRRLGRCRKNTNSEELGASFKRRGASKLGRSGPFRPAAPNTSPDQAAVRTAICSAVDAAPGISFKWPMKPDTSQARRTVSSHRRDCAGTARTAAQMQDR
jgi:hypothetical protein